MIRRRGMGRAAANILFATTAGVLLCTHVMLPLLMMMLLLLLQLRVIICHVEQGEERDSS